MGTAANIQQVENPQTAGQQKKIFAPTEAWDDTTAKARALADFRQAEMYRYQNHDRRFKVSDELYLAYRKPKTWEGTRIPRAALPVFLALGQIEALIPKVIGALFSDDPPFDVTPNLQTTLDQCRIVRDRMRYLLSLIGENGVATLREIVRRCLKQSLVYGNGIVELGWMLSELERVVYERKLVPRMALHTDLMGNQLMVPTGQTDIRLFSDTQKVCVNRPLVRPTDIRDFYIDPNCSSPNVQDAGYCATRTWMTINEFKDVANPEEFVVPSNKDLLELAHQKRNSEGDNSKLQTEVYRGNYWQPSKDYSDDPNLARLEVIRYWQKNRHVWILSRQFTTYNKPNTFGSLPFLDCFYIDVPGRFYGLSLCDLVEGDQQLAATILEARIDELSIMVHAPIIKKRGLNLPGSMQRLRPFAVWEADDPEKDYKRMEFGNVTAQAFVEYDALERRSQKTTGVTDLAVLGAPSSGGNSANRTATGISTQSGASESRAHYQVENVEDQFLVPMLNAIHQMDKRFIDPNAPVYTRGQNGEIVYADPLNILNADVGFKMVGSTKMRARQILQNGGLQMLLQAYPEIAQLMSQQGLKPNATTLANLVFDAFNLPAQDLFVPMSPQEIQQMQQPSPDKMLAMMMQREREQGAQTRQDSKDETQLLLGIITKLLTPDAVHSIVGLPSPAKIAADAQPKEPKQAAQ